MPGKHFDLDTNKNLGGNNASDIIIASQKAVKGYVDDEVSKAKLTQGDNISISNGVISGTISNLDDLKNVKITQVADGQGIAYDATNKQWINVDLAQEKQWGDITGSLENQTDLKDALDAKANNADLKTVAKTGSYTDLTNKPTIPTVSNTYSATSTNAMSGQAVASAISGKANTADLKAVATSGDYKDLTNKPTIPTITDTYSATSQNGMSGKAVASAISGKANTSDLADVATSGDYNDLENLPTIPTVTDTYSASSSSAMSGKAVASAISGKADASTLKTVATSGSYNDLTDKPNIPVVTDTYNAGSSNGMSGKAVASAISNKADKGTTLAAYGIENAYTKIEIDGMLTSVYVFQGSVDTYDQLPATSTKGFVYNVAADGMNYAWDGEKWDALGATLDLSGYVLKVDADRYYAQASHTHAISEVTGLQTALDAKVSTNSLAAVATSGNYNDLNNKPTIPTISDNYNATSSNGMSGKAVASAISGKVDATSLADVATSGSYNDLADKPTIPTVNNATLTIKRNNVVVDTFTANASANKEINIVVPTITDTYSSTSANGMSGKAVASAVSGKANDADLATVAKSGSFTDLINKPTIDTTLSSTSTNAVQNKAIKAALDGKQASINDLGTIRSNATAGKSAADTIATYGDIVSHNASEFLTAHNPIDSALSDTSTNAVQNKVIKAALDLKANASAIPTNYVPNTRKVNGKALSADVTLTASDVGATTMAAVEAKGYLTQHQSLANYYNKTEIDGKLSGAMHFKGTVNTVQALPTGASVGDMYNVKSTGANYAWDGTAWDKLSENIDLSGVVPTSRKVNGKALSADITLSASDVGATTMSAVEAKGYLVASDIAGKANSADLADVATSGSYNDLSDKPTIPSQVTESTVSGWGFTKNTGTYSKPSTGIPKTDLASAVQTSLGKADTALQEHQDISGKSDVGHTHTATEVSGLAKVATSGAYSDLTGKPTIPTITDTYSATSGNGMSGKAVASAISGKANTADLKTVATTGSYNDLTNKPTIPSTADCVKYTNNTDVNVVGNTKTVAKLNPETVFVPNGLIMGGSAQAAGLVTRGICGSGSPTATGAATKDNLYINYDGDNTYKANRQVILQAGESGTHYGNNLYQYAAARGDAVKAWVEAKGYTTNVGTITGATMNGKSVTATNGVLALGTVITAHQDISGKSNVGHKHAASDITSGLATVATSGSYNDLTNKPTIPTQTTITFRQW